MSVQFFLIKKGKAFVCDLSAEQIREYRGDFNTPGKESPYRNRSIEENLRLFEEMKEGKYQMVRKFFVQRSTWLLLTST